MVEEMRKRDIGVSLSGGGHRASLFGLGVLLYLGHAERVPDVSLNQDVTAIASVSGGSITNGLMAQSLNYKSATSAEIERFAGRLASQIARHGTLFASFRTRIYAAFLLICAVSGIVGVLVSALPFRGGWNNDRAVIGAVSLLLLFAAAVLAQARSRICEWAFKSALFHDEDGKAAPLTVLARPIRHVICATEVQTGQALWFTARGMICRGFRPDQRPADTPLARAVQASAALPLAFPPRRFAAEPTDLLRNVWPRGTRLPTRAVAVDGGVRDNLGVSAFLQWADELPLPGSQPEEPEDFPLRVSNLIVVSGSATRVKRSPLRRDLPLLGEISSLIKISGLPYKTRETGIRHALEWRFRAEVDLKEYGWPDLKGTLLHIEESPAELADEIDLWVRDWQWQGTPPDERHEAQPYVLQHSCERLLGLDPPSARWVANFLGWSERRDAWGRARAVLQALARSEPGATDIVTVWKDRAAQNAAVHTSLSRIPPEAAARLISHGYALAMARLHILWNYPLVEVPSRAYFLKLVMSDKR